MHLRIVDVFIALRQQEEAEIDWCILLILFWQP